MSDNVQLTPEQAKALQQKAIKTAMQRDLTSNAAANAKSILPAIRALLGRRLRPESEKVEITARYWR